MKIIIKTPLNVLTICSEKSLKLTFLGYKKLTKFEIELSKFDIDFTPMPLATFLSQ